jgi:hypothetical protein
VTILEQVQDELIAAARRPPLTTWISVRVVAVVIAAVLALLIAAPPSIAGLPVSAGVLASQIAR